MIGTDDETNLFRVTGVHRARKEHSWRDDLPQPPFVARPMGAFLYFLDEPASPLRPGPFGRFALTTDSFELSEADPLQRFRDVPEDVFAVLTVENGCVGCHSFRGSEVRAGHLRALNAEPVGGFALPLESYSAEVLRRFLFDQAAVASEIGASPNAVRPGVAQTLLDLVRAER